MKYEVLLEAKQKGFPAKRDIPIVIVHAVFSLSELEYLKASHNEHLLNEFHIDRGIPITIAPIFTAPLGGLVIAQCATFDHDVSSGKFVYQDCYTALYVFDRLLSHDLLIPGIHSLLKPAPANRRNLSSLLHNSLHVTCNTRSSSTPICRC